MTGNQDDTRRKCVSGMDTQTTAILRHGASLDQFRQRPFRFEDLNGEPEPKEWGPVYPRMACLDKWRRLSRKRDLTDQETRDYGRAVGDAIRALNKPPGSRPISLKCNVQNTCGTDNTAEGEEKRYRNWVEVRLPQLRIRRAGEAAVEKAMIAYFDPFAIAA